MTVHIVEDDPGVRDALSELCRAVGRKVRLYPTGEAFGLGSDVASSDVVLVDLGLPGESGSSVIRRVQAMASPPRMVVISGLPMAEIAAAMREFTGLAVMRKPLSGDIVSLLM
jgi:FixJ family two-component response regulator